MSESPVSIGAARALAGRLAGAAPEGGTAGGTAVAGIRHLLRPKSLTHRRRLSGGRKRRRLLFLGGVGLIFWIAVFGIIYRMLSYFRGAEAIGDVLAAKLLGLILLAFLAILLLSNLITSLSAFFLGRDLEVLLAAPLDDARLYGARLLETLGHSSWMVALMMLPVLSAYGVAYDAGPGFVAVALVAMASFFILPAVGGAALTLILVNVFPARRTRDLLALIALFGAAGMLLLIRMLRPERLARPEGFTSLVAFVDQLQTPTTVWLPSDWAAEAMMAPLRSGAADYFPLLLLASTAAAFVVLGLELHRRLYREGYSRAQEGARIQEPVDTLRRPLLERLLRPMKVRVRSVVAKDIRTFFRDTTQWSQLILLGVLVVIYVYNIKVLPLFSGEEVGFFLVNVVSFLNLGLAGFVLAAIAARFLFPAVSLEGRHLWLLKSAPLDLRKLLWSKYWVGLTPLLLVALLLTIGTNTILRVGPFMMAVSLLTITAMSFAIAALALGMGAIYPEFDSDNAADISTGYGGLLFMMIASVYLAAVIALEAWPVYSFLRSRMEGVPLDGDHYMALGAGLGGALLLSVIAVAVPMRAAVRRMESFEH